MTNRERLECLSSDVYVRELTVLFRHILWKYIDYEKYMDSSISDITAFVKIVGRADCKPSYEEVKAFGIQHIDDENIDISLCEFIRENTRPCILLEKIYIGGLTYWIVLRDGDEETICVSEECLLNILYRNEAEIL